MEVLIDIDETINDTKIIIKCKEKNQNIENLYSYINSINKNSEIKFYKNSEEYYLTLNEILFFETYDNKICAHTLSDMYEIKFKLYELQNILPNNFIRISKSAIININKIYSIRKNITSSSVVKFKNSYKQIYVSRMYFKLLKERMEEINYEG